MSGRRCSQRKGSCILAVTSWSSNSEEAKKSSSTERSQQMSAVLTYLVMIWLLTSWNLCSHLVQKRGTEMGEGLQPQTEAKQSQKWKPRGHTV
jgi:hypothetical protein